MTIKDRLKELVLISGSNAKFGEIVGKTETTVRNWCNGRSEPKIKDLLLISDKFKVNLDWLLRENTIDVNVCSDYEMIPQVPGLDPYAEPITKKHFSKRWLSHFLGDNFSASDLVLLKSGMGHRQMFDKTRGFEFIRKGDILLLDMSRTNSDSGGMFLEKKENLPYMVRSFDHDSPLVPEEFGKIIGRIAWLGREL